MASRVIDNFTSLTIARSAPTPILELYLKERLSPRYDLPRTPGALLQRFGLDLLGGGAGELIDFARYLRPLTWGDRLGPLLWWGVVGGTCVALGYWQAILLWFRAADLLLGFLSATHLDRTHWNRRDPSRLPERVAAAALCPAQYLVSLRAPPLAGSSLSSLAAGASARPKRAYRHLGRPAEPLPRHPPDALWAKRQGTDGLGTIGEFSPGWGKRPRKKRLLAKVPTMWLLAIKAMLGDRGRLAVSLLAVTFSVVLVNLQGGLLLGMLGKASLLVDFGGADIWIGHRHMQDAETDCTPIPSRWRTHPWHAGRASCRPLRADHEHRHLA